MTDIATPRQRVLATPADVVALRQAGTAMTIIAVQSINPYTGRPSFDGRRVPGSVDAEAYRDFQAPASPEAGQRPLPAIADLQAAARRWGIQPDHTVIVYDTDRSLTAARAWWVLRWAGLADVRVLDGGLWAWEQAGLPTATDAATPPPSDIVLTTGQMPTFDADAALTWAETGVLLDARIRTNYIGGPVAAGQPPRGHIPGALSAPAPDNVTDYGTFIDDFALTQLYGALGADGTRPVGVYCGAGMSAAHSVLALAAVGVTAALYPGSWSAWVYDATRPVVVGNRVR